MDKVEQRSVIPEAGHKSPESEHLPILAKKQGITQGDEDERLMALEIALVHALQGFVAKSETSQP